MSIMSSGLACMSRAWARRRSCRSASRSRTSSARRADSSPNSRRAATSAPTVPSAPAHSPAVPQSTVRFPSPHQPRTPPMRSPPMNAPVTAYVAGRRAFTHAHATLALPISTTVGRSDRAHAWNRPRPKPGAAGVPSQVQVRCPTGCRPRRAVGRGPAGGSRRHHAAHRQSVPAAAGPFRVELFAGFGDRVELETEQPAMLVDAGQQQLAGGGGDGRFVNLPAGRQVVTIV
jgi:hypothetical protein